MVMQEFWDKAHREQNHISLSNTSGLAELSTLEIEDINRKDVLIIGVGTGMVVEFCRFCGARVSALDISSVALENVKDKIVLGYLPHAELPESAFDFVLSANVAQHISHADFEIQTQKVLKSLRGLHGVYALQFIHIDMSLESNHDFGANGDDVEAQKWGAVSRSPGRVRQLVKRHGGRIDYLSIPRQSDIQNLFAYTVHIRKA